MKRQLTLALVATTLIAALFIGAAVIAYTYNRYLTERERAIEFAENYLQERFEWFDRLIADDEMRLDGEIKSILPQVAARLKADANFPDQFDVGQLNAIAEEFAVDEVFVINRQGFIVATNFTPDMNFYLRGVSPKMAGLLDGLYGTGNIIVDRFNISVNTGAIKKYSYYGPVGSDYIIEVAHHLKPFIASVHSENYVNFLFDEMFALDLAETKGIIGADIYIPHAVGAWSLLNPGKVLEEPLQTHILQTEDVLRVEDGAFKMDVFRRFDRLYASNGQTPHIVTHVRYDHFDMAHHMVKLTFMMIAIAMTVLIGSFFVLSRMLDRSLLRHIGSITDGLLALGEGKNGNVDLKGAPEEIVLIGRTIDKMQRKIHSREQALQMVNDEFQQKLEQRTAELVVANQQLAELSLTDALTGLANRRSFDEVLSAELRRMRRSGQPLCLLLMDVDYFKRFNDAAGHVAGDDALRLIGSFLTHKMRRASDLVARYGGEEFAIILPEMSPDHALTFAQDVIDGISELAIVHPDSDISPHVTVSIGATAVTVCNSVPMQWLLHATDQKLYEAKRQGRNRVVFADLGVPDLSAAEQDAG